MPKRSAKSDPILSAKRALDHIIAKHDPESVSKLKTAGQRKQIAKKPTQKRQK